jgi:hypothetical protein
MSEQPTPADAVCTGQVSSTPEGGPVDAGAPVQEPGAGQVQATPEAGPLAEDETLVPPTWQEHMRGPILGLDDAPPAADQRRGEDAPASSAPGAERAEPRPGRGAPFDDELKKWPPYSGKPVSEVRWQDAMRYAAPVAAQAEKLAIQAIDLSARGLSKLARYLEARQKERQDR